MLDRALERLPPPPDDETVELGLATPDDASAVRLASGERIVSSLDVFRAFTDDAYLVGKVAVANSVSDLYAKGIVPRYALAMVAIPEELDGPAAEEELAQVLMGIRESLDGLGVTLLGGHTTTADGLMVGLSVEGIVGPSAPLLRADLLRAGRALILTKALGTGVLWNADMRGLARGEWVEAALASMTRLNDAACEVALEWGAESATDVTGFGLAGHLGEMLRAAGVSARLELSALPALPGALELLARGERSTAHAANAEGRRGVALGAGVAGKPALELLFDPQTSGGLILAVADESADGVVAELRRRGLSEAARIGHTRPARADGVLLEVVLEEEEGEG